MGYAKAVDPHLPLTTIAIGFGQGTFIGST